MTIKSKTIIPKEKEVSYPCLMKSKNNNSIALFIGPSKGVVVGGGVYPMGHFAVDWFEDGFVPFTGKAVLSND